MNYSCDLMSAVDDASSSLLFFFLFLIIIILFHPTTSDDNTLKEFENYIWLLLFLLKSGLILGFGLVRRAPHNAIFSLIEWIICTTCCCWCCWLFLLFTSSRQSGKLISVTTLSQEEIRKSITGALVYLTKVGCMTHLNNLWGFYDSLMYYIVY